MNDDDYDYEERIAICMIDGGLSEEEAKQIAFEQMMLQERGLYSEEI